MGLPLVPGRSLSVRDDALHFMTARNGDVFRTDGTGQGMQLVGQFAGNEVYAAQFSPDLIGIGQALVAKGYSSDRGRMELWGLPE